jgi:hypothetical protein
MISRYSYRDSFSRALRLIPNTKDQELMRQPWASRDAIPEVRRSGMDLLASPGIFN